MKYIIQFFREKEAGFLQAPDSIMEFQVIFSAKNDTEAQRKSKEVFKAWKKDQGQIGVDYTSQLQYLNSFIANKESQYKVLIGKK